MLPYYRNLSRQAHLAQAAVELEGVPFNRVNCVRLIQEMLLASSDWQEVDIPDVPLDFADHNHASQIVAYFEEHPAFVARFLSIDLSQADNQVKLSYIHPGDVLGIRKGACIHHSGMALPNGQFIHTLNTTHGAHTTPLNSRVYLPRIERVWRLMESSSFSLQPTA